MEFLDALVLGFEMGAHFVENESRSEHVDFLGQAYGLIRLFGNLDLLHCLFGSLVHGGACADGEFPQMRVILFALSGAGLVVHALSRNLFASKERSFQMFLIQKLFRLLDVDRVTGVEIRQTQVVPLESLDLVLQLLLE